MKKFLRVSALFLILFFVFTSAYSSSFQSGQNLDSLLKKADRATDSEQGIKLATQVYDLAQSRGDKRMVIKSLNVIAGDYFDIKDYAMGKKTAEKALSIAAENHADSLTGNSWLFLGMARYGNAEFAKSISDYENAALVFEKTGQRARLAVAYINIGISKRQLSKYVEAITVFVKAADIFEEVKNRRNLAVAYSSIAICFNEMGNFDKALEYNRRALALRQKIADKEAVSESENNIGFIFYRHKMLDSAIYYLTKSLAIIYNDRDSSGLVITLQNLGGAWRMKGNDTRAENYIQRSLNIAKKYKMGEELARGSSDLAEIYLQEKKYTQALDNINITIDTATRRELRQILINAYDIKSRIYYAQEDYKNALLFANKKTALKDSLFTIERDKKINELDVQYQTKQRESNIAALSQQNKLQNRIVLILSIAAVFLLISFGVAYINFRKKNEANERIQNLMREMHHRVKNNLQILSGLFSMQINNLSDEKTKAALRENEARLTSMNLIHNKLYLDNTTTKIEMNDYLTKLLNHIKDSFSGYKQSEVDLKIEVNEIMLEADKAVAIGLIANELATNAFKYAFANRPNGEIRLALTLVEKSKVLLTMADNGIGLKETGEEKAPSFGLKLVNLMARQLNSSLVVKSEHGMFYQMEISI
ncbi:MAG TPA: tetratricopeptide repeat protein [Mucilaginibacter sp.]